MNLVARCSIDGGYFISSIRKEGKVFSVRTMWANRDGRAAGNPCLFPYVTEREAIDGCRYKIKIKCKRRSCVMLNPWEVPDLVKRHFLADVESQVTKDELLRLMKQKGRERIVVFSNVDGMDSYFDLEIGYVAYLTETEDFFEVYDKYGEPHIVDVSRLKSVKKSE